MCHFNQDREKQRYKDEDEIPESIKRLSEQTQECFDLLDNEEEIKKIEETLKEAESTSKFSKLKNKEAEIEDILGIF